MPPVGVKQSGHRASGFSHTAARSLSCFLSPTCHPAPSLAPRVASPHARAMWAAGPGRMGMENKGTPGGAHSRWGGVPGRAPGDPASAPRWAVSSLGTPTSRTTCQACWLRHQNLPRAKSRESWMASPGPLKCWQSRLLSGMAPPPWGQAWQCPPQPLAPCLSPASLQASTHHSPLLPGQLRALF